MQNSTFWTIIFVVCIIIDIIIFINSKETICKFVAVLGIVACLSAIVLNLKIFNI